MNAFPQSAFRALNHPLLKFNLIEGVAFPYVYRLLSPNPVVQEFLLAGNLAGHLAQRVFTTTPRPLPGVPTTPAPHR